MGGGREREGEKRGDKGLHTRQVSRTAGTRIATPVGFGALPLSLTRILDLHVFTAFLTNRFRKVRLTYRNSAVQYSVRSVGPAWPTEVRATTRRGPEDHQRSLALCSTIVATQIAGMLYPHASPPGRVPLHTAARAHAQHAQRRDSHRSFLAQIHQILPFLVPECACSTCRRRCATRRGQNRVSIRLRSRLSRLREVPRASCPTRATGYACELVKKRSSEPQTQKRPLIPFHRLYGAWSRPTHAGPHGPRPRDARSVLAPRAAVLAPRRSRSSPPDILPIYTAGTIHCCTRRCASK